MIGVAGVGCAGEPTDRAGTTCAGMFGRFEDDISRSFAEVDASAIAVEGSADVRIEDFEGVEAVDVVTREAFAAPGHDDVGASRAEEFGALHQRVGRGGAGGDDGRHEREAAAEKVGNLLGAGAAIVQFDVSVAGVVQEEIVVVLFGFVHAADGDAGE